MRKEKLLRRKPRAKAASVSKKPQSERAKPRIEASADAAVSILQRTHADPHAIDASGIHLLQRTIGNQAVGRLLIQRKLTLGPTGDKYEQEADQVAKQVATSLPASDQPGVQRQEEEEEMVQAKAASSAMGGPISDEIENDIQSARGSGQPLADNVRQPMENAFGADFSGVKVHTGSQSDSLNQSVQARAFTTGKDIFFRQGEYSPGSSGGQELLAHELTHVVQQSGAAVQRQEQPSQPQLQADGSSIQRMKPLPSDPAARRKEIERRIRAGQQKRKQQKALDNSYLGRFASWAGFSYTAAPEAEAEEEDDEGVTSIKGEEDSATYEAEATWGKYDEEEEEEDDGEKDPLGIKEIEIDLGKIDGELETRLGKAKGSAKASQNIEGIKGEASGSLGNELATAKLSGELARSGIKGEGKFGLNAAATKEHQSGVMGWKILGGELQGNGAVEEFIGLKGEASAKGKVGKGKGSLKGKASAFAGVEIKGNVNVKLKVDGNELTSAKGELGATFGVGGSLEGKISWANGVIELGGKGKVAAGLGFSYGYEIKIDTNKIGETLSARLLPAWLSWDTLQSLGNLGSYLFGG